MTQVETTSPIDKSARPSEHRGSASPQLSGWSVVAAWSLSLAFHSLLFLVMLALVFPYSVRDSAPLPPAPRVELVGSVDGTAFVNTPEPNLPDAVPLTEPQTPRPEPREFTPLDAMHSQTKPELSIIGIGAGGGDVEKYGLNAGGVPAPEFFGLGGTVRGARRIVFVVDRSGSMLGTFIYVQEELKRSIRELRRSQSFHIIFFNKEPLHNPPKRFLPAIEAHRQQAFAFLDEVVPQGGTKPQQALYEALQMEPDLIYLLSDGENFPPDVLSRLDRWNKDRRVRICTIAYVDPTGSELLELMAREHHGEFTFVSEDELP